MNGLLAILSTALLLQQSADSTAARPAKKLALLVGVADYPEAIAEKLPDLVGPAHDIAAARELLMSRFGFTDESILLLVNEQASHEAVVRAFCDHLIEKADSGSEIVFWYSGHGAQVPDASGAEANGLDSTLVLADSRSATDDGEYDFTDDELSALIDALMKKRANVLVVTDACHSGGATRGGGRGKSGARGMRPLATQRLAGFWPSDVELRDDDDTPRDRTGFIHLAACSADQEAQERPFVMPSGETAIRGNLSHTLCWFLDQAQPGDSFRTVADRTALWIANYEPDQTPQYEGDVDRQLFAGEFAARPPGFAVRFDKDDNITISAGRIHGIRPKTEFALSDSQGNSVGTVRTAFLGTGETTVLWNGDVPENARHIVLRAVPIAGSGGRAPLALHVSDTALAERLAARASTQVAFAAGDAREAHRLERETGTEGVTSLVLLAPDGVPLWRIAAADAESSFDDFARELDSAIDHELVHRELFALPAEPGSLRVTASLHAPDAATLERIRREGVPTAVAPRIESIANSAGVARTYRAKFDLDSNVMPVAEINIANESGSPCFITVVSVCEDRNRTVIYPHEGERDQVLPPGSSRPILVSLNGDAHGRFSRPLRDRLLVIATIKPVDFHALAARTTYRGTAPPAVLERAFRGIATRGGSDDFGITAIDVWVPGNED